MLTGLYNYDLIDGLKIVWHVLFLLVLLVAIRYSLQLFRALRGQDDILTKGKTDEVIPQIATYFRVFIIHIIGYRGEKREITPMHEVDSSWMASNFGLIFRRFLIFYSIYIPFGILLTRPVYFESDSLIFYKYDRENLNAIFYLISYIVTNAIADCFSIYFTFRNLENIIKSGRVFLYGAFDFLLATLFFLPNQIISCTLWYVKRAENNVEFSGDWALIFVDLTFWPYALVENVDINSTIGQLFPGQLIITGTVFFPTVSMILIMVIYRLFLSASYYIKIALIYLGIDKLCRKYIEIVSYSPFQMQPEGSFGYCNTALIIAFNSFLLSMVYDSGKALWLSFQG